MSQTRQRNGILRRCAKGHRDVQNEARALQKSMHPVLDLAPAPSCVLVFDSASI